jgi:hypothetical protein
VVGLSGLSEMPKRGRLCGDSSQASPLPGLGRLARQTPSFGNNNIVRAMRVLDQKFAGS